MAKRCRLCGRRFFRPRSPECLTCREGGKRRPVERACDGVACTNVFVTTGPRKFCDACRAVRDRIGRRAYDERHRAARMLTQQLDPRIEAQLARLAAARRAKRSASWATP